MFNRLGAMMLALCMPLAALAADAYPNRTIRLIVPFGPGLSTDATARYFAEEMGRIVGQTIVVENKAGGQGIVGTQAAATAAPDGYTIVFASNGSHAGNVVMFKKLPYDAIADFAPIGAISAAPWALAVRNDLPPKNFVEFVKYAKAQQATAKLTIAHGSASSQACVALLKTKGQIDVADVPYKSLAPAEMDVQAGRLDAVFLPLGVAIQSHKAGKLRVLAISAPKRSDLAPEIPTIGETLPGYELISWVGLMAPAKTPPDVVNKLWDAMRQVLAKPETKALLTRFGHDALALDPAAFARLQVADIASWRQIVAAAGIEPQ